MVIIGPADISLDDVVRIAGRAEHALLSDDAGWRARIAAGAAFLDAEWRAGRTIYGVTTGYGDSCGTAVPADLVEELPLQLTRYHGCGMGAVLEPAAARAVLLVRMASLARGYSGVRMCVLEALCRLLEEDVLPLIPEEGSVGASGDLTPLSYVAALLCGERDALHGGRRRPAREILLGLGIEPLQLAPKEALAIMNGTSGMTALACLPFEPARYLARLASLLTAAATAGLQGNREHFAERLFEAKPHPGQQQSARWIREDLGALPIRNGRLQAPYSLRCAPHVIGVLLDALTWIKTTIEIEINSANDNPLIDAERGEFLHGGHFYGGHIAFAMDALKAAVANCADLLDRQLSLLVDTRTSHGLPPNLSGAAGPRRAINHGFKAVQIAVSAWTAEALKLTMPASVFSRSTECHNQDKVSMGTIAARDCLRVLELTEQVSGAAALAVLQALRLRARAREILPADLSPAMQAFCAAGERFAFVEEDRALESELRAALAMIQDKAWNL